MITRIPLDVVVTATGHRTPNVIVAVMASELDALEAENARLVEGLQRLYNQAFDAGYSTQEWVAAVLDGSEPGLQNESEAEDAVHASGDSKEAGDG